MSGVEKLSLEIEVRPYLMDHRFLGKAVLPAVEAMRILADSVASRFEGVDVTIIRDASFAKFLFLPIEQDRIEAFNHVEVLENGRTRSSLVTKLRAGKSSITRAVEHASLHFDPEDLLPDEQAFDPHSIDSNSILGDDSFEVDPKSIYEELVPFGPSFRNIVAPVRLTRNGAVAEVSGGESGLAQDSCLGSPFPLDAAFHAACVWGQRYLHYTAFPLGIRERCVFRKTCVGESFYATAIPIRADSKSLLFDIRIHGRDGELREANTGVFMKDVSAGRLKPPSWIMKRGGDK